MFSTLNINGIQLQVKVEEKACGKKAFTSYYEQYGFVQMSFGSVKASKPLQHAMDTTLSPVE